MGTVWQACGGAVSGALPEHHGVGESSSAGGDVNRGSAGEIETTHEEGPAIRVPRPAGDGVVDQSRPDEDENEAWKHTATVGGGTNSERRTMHQSSALHHCQYP